MVETSIWIALRNPVFRRLWVASVISGTWVAAHDTAATCMMNTLTPSPFFLSLMSTVASMPFFLFTLPAGTLADMVDRKNLLCLINLWLAIGAAGLAVLSWLHLLNPYLILTYIFLLGVGFAFNAPAWSSIVPQVVSNAELPSAVTLGGLQLNISGIIGPALGGMLVPLIGANFVFAANAACFLGMIVALLGWKKTTAQASLPVESFLESFVTAIRYVRYSSGLQIVLARNALFALCISAIPALMPVIGMKVLYLSPSFAYQHECGLGHCSSRYHSMAKGSLPSEYAHYIGKPIGIAPISVDGGRAPARSFLSFRGACWRWMDSICCRTLGSGAARHTRLGARPNERHSHCDFAGSNGFRWSDVGLRRYYSRTEVYIAGSRGPNADKPGSSLPAIDQLYRNPEF